MAVESYRYEPGSAADFSKIVELMRSARAETSHASVLQDPNAPDLAENFKAWVRDPHNILIVHQTHQGFVALLLAVLTPASVLADKPHVRIELMFVEPGYRRRGVGRALLAQVAIFAREHHVEWVITTPPSGNRLELRFLSGLGFAAVGTQRIAQIGTLTRKLEMPISSRERRIQTLDDLIARRKRAREIENTPPSGTMLDYHFHKTN